METNKIYLGKWEDQINRIDDDSVDLVLTSPPYNVRLGDNKLKKDKYKDYDDNLPYEDYLSWMTSLFTECNRVLKKGGRFIINIGDGQNGSVPTHVDFTYRLLKLDQFSKVYGNYNPFKMITTIVWDKKQIGNSCSWGSFQSPSCPSFPTPFEFLIVVGKGTKKHQGNGKSTVTKDNFMRNSRAMWEILPETSMMRKYNHPAMFPEELAKRCIDQFTYVNDIVFDPFTGAGTTCAVAKKMGRRYLGIEMSVEYYNTSIERLSQISEITESGVPKWIL